MRALSRGEAEILVAGCYLGSEPQRGAELTRRVEACPEAGPALVEALEKHGLLVLFARNVEAVGAPLPEATLGALKERAEALAEDARRDEATLGALLPALRSRGIDVVLLKGASLATDRYAAGDRAQGDLDLLVRAEDVPRAVRVGAECGLVPRPCAFPVWWYRWSHFHLKLAPVTPFRREVEIHWRLSSRWVGWSAEPEHLWARARATSCLGVPCLTLDPIDRFLHLATHLVSHLQGRGGLPDEEWVLGALQQGDNPLRLKWVLDLWVELEALVGEVEPRQVTDRAVSWGAGQNLGWCLHLVAETFALSPECRDWVKAARLEAAPSLPGCLPRDGRAHPGFGFRLAVLKQIPAWLFPGRELLERRLGGRRAGFLDRLVHGVSMAAFLGLSALFLPFAWAGRAWAEQVRVQDRRACLAPERILADTVAWKKGNSQAG